VASANVVAMLSGAPDAGFARVYTPRPLRFPQDHGAHPEYQTEWWYFTGNLADAAGNRFGYQWTLFRSALAPAMAERDSELATNQVYMAHFAITDAEADLHTSFERYSRGAGGLAGAEVDPAVAIWLEDWSVRQEASGALHLQASAEQEGEPFAIDLLLTETQPPVLHGLEGLSQKGPEAGNASIYYSLIGLQSEGTVTSRGRAYEVAGTSWMDHEFGTSALSDNAVGWDWFSIQLENGAAIMFAQIRTTDGGRIGEFSGTLAQPDGSRTPIEASDFEIAIHDEWTSPRTGIVYPSGWTVTLPQHEISLEVTPLVRDQEMKVSFVYWEGAVDVTGVMNGQPVRGQGYVELTGYGAELGEYQR
jgi:predicted secreted hydrolase